MSEKVEDNLSLEKIINNVDYNKLAEVNRLSIAKNIKSIKEVAEAKIIDVTPLGEDYD